MALRLQLATHRNSMRLITIPFVSALIIILPLPAFAAEPKQTGEGKALHAFFDAEWEYEMEQSPVRASFLGDRRWNDRWGDSSLEAIRKREAHAIDALARLKKFDRAKLSPAEQLNYDLFQKDLEI